MSSWLPDLADAGDAPAKPRYLAIAEAIGKGIEDGRLAPGARLPTQRALAYRLGVSVHTVSSAYAEAERRGYVSGEVGRGTFVRPRHRRGDGQFFVDRRREDLIDLSINRPAIGHLHASRIRAAFADLAQATDLSAMLACRPIVGLDRHREAAAVWLGRRGVDVPPERIILTNGVVHGLLVALAALTKPGDLVATECLVDHGLIALAGVLHFRLEGLAIDAEGILPDAFEAACRAGGVRALCCTPSLSNPTVATMPAERRRAVAAIARAHGVAVVENDVYGPLLPDDADRPPPLHAFCPERAYYLTSFTKAVVSGLRVGYLAAPAAAVPRLTTRLRATSWMATPLVAEIATRWIEDGTAEELIAWQRAELRARNDVLRRALAGFDLAHYPTALHAWLTLPGGWRAEGFAGQARLRGVAVAPAEPFVVGRLPEPHAARLSLGAPSSHAELERGLAVLAEILREEPEPAFVPI